MRRCGVAVLSAVPLGPAGVDVVGERDGAAHARVVGLEPRALPAAPKDAGHARQPRSTMRTISPSTPRGSAGARARRPCRRAWRPSSASFCDVDVVAARAQARHEPEAALVHAKRPLALVGRGRGATRALPGPRFGPRRHLLRRGVPFSLGSSGFRSGRPDRSGRPNMLGRSDRPGDADCLNALGVDGVRPRERAPPSSPERSPGCAPGFPGGAWSGSAPSLYLSPGAPRARRR